jgi:PAS domain S-box-containing protein
MGAAMTSRISLALRTGGAAAHETLRDSERHFQLLVQGVKEYAIFMLDPEGRIATWNSGAERIKGYRAEEIIGEHFSRFYTEEDKREDLPMRSLQQAVAEDRFEWEGWRIRKDGSRFRANVMIAPIRDDAGKVIGFAKVTRDVTERHLAQEMLDKAREQLLRSQKMEAIGQLTGGVAHDFNNLLTIVIGNLEIAQRNLGDLSEGIASRLKRSLDRAMRGARRAAILTERLLAFARQQPLDPKPLDVNEFIAAEVEFLQRSLGETIEVEAVGSAGVWAVEVDRHQLEATLLNLAVNARDAMPTGGKLTIETSNAYLDQDYCHANPEVEPGQYVLIAVSDEGAGMTKEVMDRAFDPFFSTKGVGRGTGLGLSQVYGFIKQSKGHVKIYTELDEGTTVKIYLPRLLPDINQKNEREQLAEAVEGPGHETILVVEDDDDVRAYFVEVLRDLNYRVLSAHDAVSALGLIDQEGIRIDLLLTDVVLPGMNGRQLAEKAQDRRPSLKVLFTTGYTRNAIVHQGRLDAGVAMIQKPTTQEGLASRIRDLLDTPPSSPDGRDRVGGLGEGSE